MRIVTTRWLTGQAHLFAAAFAILLIGLAVTNQFFERHNSFADALANNAQQELVLIAEGASGSLADALITDDFSRIERTLAFFGSIPVIQRAELYTADGSAIVQLIIDDAGEVTFDYSLPNHLGLLNHGFTDFYPEPLYSQSIRVNGITVGWLRIKGDYRSQLPTIENSWVQVVLGSLLLWAILTGLVGYLWLQAWFRRNLEKRLATDPLTGATSRYGFNLMYADGERTKSYALFLIDLDNFKSINDSYGHVVGDQSLKEITNTMHANFSVRDEFVRLGGDEFVLLVKAEEWAEVRVLGERLSEIFSSIRIPAEEGQLRMHCTAGGVLLGVNDELSARLSQADLALRRAKERGKDQVNYADESFLLAEGKRGAFLDLATVRRAIQKGEIHYFIQPIVDVSKRKTLGYEALLRWPLETGQTLMPDMFLDIYFRALRDPEIAKFIDQRRRKLLKRAAENKVEMFTFNIRIEDLSRPGLPQSLSNDFGSEWLSKINLVLEISERGMPRYLKDEMAQVVKVLDSIRCDDIQIALDDFGAEESNLVRMLQLDIDYLKLDRSLVSAVGESEKSQEIVSAIARLCNQLDITVIGEGVESKEQSDLLADLGVTVQQGFYLGYPQRPDYYFQPLETLP